MKLLNKLKIVYFFLFLLYFVLQSNGQNTKDNFENYQLNKILSIEDYKMWDKEDFPHPTEIVGLFQLDNSILVWVTLSGRVTFYDFINEKVVNQNQILNNAIITKSYFNKTTKKLYFCEKGKIISLYNVKNTQIELDTVLVNFSNQDSITINNFAINPSGNCIATFSTNEIIFWQLNQDSWIKKYFALKKNPFSLTFLDDSTIIVGSYDGYGEILNLDDKKILKSKKIFDNEIFQYSVSPDKLQFAVTDQREVKIYESKFGYPIRIKSNLLLIGNIKWLDNNKVFLSGEGLGFEIWDISKNRRAKLVASENVLKKSKQKTKYKSTLPLRSSYLLLSDLNSTISLKKFHSKITAIDVNEHHIATAEENLDLKIFELQRNKVNIRKLMNCNEEIGKTISDIQINDQKSVYVGSLNSGGGFDLDKKEVHPFLSNNYWMSYDQIDFKSFKDVKIFKSNNGFEDREVASINFEPYVEVGKKLSAINKKIRKRKELNLRQLTNPSGFKVSPDKKFLITFDATGHIELLNLKNFNLISSEKITDFPIVSSHFINDKELMIVDTSGNIFTYRIRKCEELILFKKYNIGINIKKTSYNGINFLTVFDKQKIAVYDLSKKQFISSLHNKYKNFNIDLLKFIPNSDKFIYVLNEKIFKEIKKENNPKIYNETETTFSKGISSHSIIINQNIIALGNSFGDIIFYYKDF